MYALNPAPRLPIHPTLPVTSSLSHSSNFTLSLSLLDISSWIMKKLNIFNLKIKSPSLNPVIIYPPCVFSLLFKARFIEGWAPSPLLHLPSRCSPSTLIFMLMETKLHERGLHVALSESKVYGQPFQDFSELLDT